MFYIPGLMPVFELDSEDRSCCICESDLVGECYNVDDFEGFACEECMECYVEQITQEARQYAETNCKITNQLPFFDADNQFRCTPDGYAGGNRYSNTPNAFLAFCRHSFTNYEELIRDYSKSNYDVYDQIYYQEIKDWVQKIILDRIDESQPDVSHEFDQFRPYLHAL